MIYCRIHGINHGCQCPAFAYPQAEAMCQHELGQTHVEWDGSTRCSQCGGRL